jgi:hypothetical protein
MGAIVAGIRWIAQFLVGFIGSRAAQKTAEYVALKGLYVTLIVTVLPFALVKMGTYLVSKLFAYIGTETQLLTPVIFDATGMLAWLLNSFQIPFCFSVILSAYVARYSIKTFKILLVWK